MSKFGCQNKINVQWEQNNLHPYIVCLTLWTFSNFQIKSAYHFLVVPYGATDWGNGLSPVRREVIII